MTRDPRYDILFEPVKIGPVTAKNRFFQVPHCTGMGWLRPRMLAEMRGMKAEGGWGVVCTEYNSIHPSSDDLPHPSASLWDDSDIRAHRLMTEKVHEYGALAGAELWYGGARTVNLMTREVPMDVGSLPNPSGLPFQTRTMDKSDIRQLRHWHKKAALRAKEADFDIVYVYATHGYLLSNFLNPRTNTRSDEYGGSLENRVRLVRELIEETKDAVGDRCAIAVRFSADQEIGEDGKPIHGERHDMFEFLSELPDLWDINVADYSVEMGVSRFIKEASLEPYMSFVKKVTSKPIVTVGRFTSPDTMVNQVKRGITDFIGAARPSIADPFLPAKIEAGREQTIRECIGCNVCYSGDSLGVPIRCTQNPTMGEEWRKGWHPEKIEKKASNSKVLIVGAGPAGLEAARALGARGYEVLLSEATRELGGRVTLESRLPGMSEYARVRDYREQALLTMPNVEVYRESNLTAEDVFEVNADHVVIATGAKWRRERFDGKAYLSVDEPGTSPNILTPDDVMAGKLPSGPTLVYDEDGYYMGSLISELIREQGLAVTLVTPADSVSAWSGFTDERWRVRTQLMKMGVKLVLSHSLISFDGSRARLSCEYTGEQKDLPIESVIMVTQRKPSDGLYHDLIASTDGRVEDLPFTLKRIGDCEAPAIIAAAIYAGHRYARVLDTEINHDEPLRHDRVEVGNVSASQANSDTEAQPSQKYLETLLLYYEEEIEGEAYFYELADRLTVVDQKKKMLLMGDIERHAANAVRPLLDKYGLTPRTDMELHVLGQNQAASDTGNWEQSLEEMRKTFPGYIDDFRNLEGMAPKIDLTLLQFLTEHEHAAIEFLDKEISDKANSAAPLIAYLKSTPESFAVVKQT